MNKLKVRNICVVPWSMSPMGRPCQFLGPKAIPEVLTAMVYPVTVNITLYKTLFQPCIDYCITIWVKRLTSI